MRPSNDLEKKTPSDTYSRVTLVCRKVRTTIGIQSGPDAFDESSLNITFLTILRVTEICSFVLVLEWKMGKETTDSLRLEFLRKVLANNFALSVKKTTPQSR